MANKRWQPGNVIRKSVEDGWTYYGQLLEFPWAVFYRRRTQDPDADIAAITASPVAFTVAAHKDLISMGEWRSIGSTGIPAGVAPPAEQAIWDDPDHCRIIDLQSNMRAATVEECDRLEVAAVWEPEHIEDRLSDVFAGRPDRWREAMIPRRS
jgi:hypothetical protein